MADSVNYVKDENAPWSEYHANPCDATRNVLVEAYYGECRKLAATVWQRSSPRSIDVEDFISDCVALMIKTAIPKWKPEKGVRFTLWLAIIFRRYLWKKLDKCRPEVEYPDDIPAPPSEISEAESILRKIFGDVFIDSRLAGDTLKVCGKKAGISQDCVTTKLNKVRQLLV